MSKVKASIAKVSARPVNGVQKVLIEMANGDQLWVNLSYVNKVLDSQFLTGARPTALKGAVVAYDKVTHKAGEEVKDKNGKIVEAGKTYSKDGYSLYNFDIEEIGEAGEKFGDAYDKAAINHTLKSRFTSLLPSKAVPTKVEEEANVPEMEEEEAEVG